MTAPLKTALALALAAAALAPAVGAASSESFVKGHYTDVVGDSSGAVDLHRVYFFYSAETLRFKVVATEKLSKDTLPCVNVYAGKHNTADDHYAVGCSGKVISTSDGKSKPIKRKIKDKSVTYTVDPKHIGKPLKFRFQAVVGAEGETWDKVPDKPTKVDIGHF